MKAYTVAIVDNAVASNPAPSPPRQALTITASRKRGDNPGVIKGDDRNVPKNASPTVHTAIKYRRAARPIPERIIPCIVADFIKVSRVQANRLNYTSVFYK
jgi:hypothetical protein